MGIGESATALLALCQLILAVGTFLAIRKLRFLNHATNLRVTSVQDSLYKLHEIYKLEALIADKRKRLENPSTELQEFLMDMSEHGCGILRISPDAVILRGMRK